MPTVKLSKKKAAAKVLWQRDEQRLQAAAIAYADAAYNVHAGSQGWTDKLGMLNVELYRLANAAIAYDDALYNYNHADDPED